ncbi:MAG: 50S ribosomal protein L29 [Chloroflexi bacterium]|nr:50S ribosomal protein L29 [Chloroflexota bacterium]
MKPSDIRALNDSELAKRLDELQQELFNLRFQLTTRQLENYKKIEAVRRDIARVKTIMRERELEAAGA